MGIRFFHVRHLDLTTILFSLGSVLFIWVPQPMISSKGCTFFPFKDGQVWAGKTKAKLLRAKSPRYLSSRSLRYPMTNIA
jgi:hypothetical protein